MNHEGHHPRHETAKDGMPLIRNKNGAYVVNQKKKKALAAATAGKDGAKSKDLAMSDDLTLVPTATNDNATKLVNETVKSAVRVLFTQNTLDDASTIATILTVASTTTGATLFDSAAILATLNR